MAGQGQTREIRERMPHQGTQASPDQTLERGTTRVIPFQTLAPRMPGRRMAARTRTPEFQMPGFQTPEFQTPGLQTPGLQTPEPPRTEGPAQTLGSPQMLAPEETVERPCQTAAAPFSRQETSVTARWNWCWIPSSATPL